MIAKVWASFMRRWGQPQNPSRGDDLSTPIHQKTTSGLIGQHIDQTTACKSWRAALSRPITAMNTQPFLGEEYAPPREN